MAEEKLAESEASDQPADEQQDGEPTAGDQTAAQEAAPRGHLIDRARAARDKTPARASRARLSKPMAESVRSYTASIAYDKRLAPYDVDGSIAHAMMLAKQGIISRAEGRQIVAGLRRIADEIERGTFYFRDVYEDVHLNVEARLVEIVGDVGGKLHTARSRNDQVALDMRLFTKDAIKDAIDGLNDLRGRILDKAEAHIDAAMPGYTHMQRGQPVLLSHHLLAYSEMFERDTERFREILRRTDVMPLGSGALGGAPYPLDRPYLARRLGFSRVSNNSMDAVSDRDFVIEYHAAASLAMMHLSRLSEELVLWSTEEFGFVTLDDAYATGSSMMPQKKNPDVAELARGRTGRVYGNLIAALTMMKGLPLAYNRDLQEDKEPLFNTVDILTSSLRVIGETLARLDFETDHMQEVAERGYALATDVADYLVKRGVPFREAHGIVGEVVQHAISQGVSLAELSLEEYRSFSEKFDEDVRAIDVRSAIASRSAVGGTALSAVAEELEAAKKRFAAGVAKLSWKRR